MLAPTSPSLPRRAALFSALLAGAAASLDCGGKVILDSDPGMTSGDVSSSTTTTAGATTTTGTGGAGGQGGSGGQGGVGGQGGQGGEPPPPPVAVYAHSDTTLYLLDPNTKALTTLGDFKGCTGVIDLAVDRAGALWATTSNALVTVDPKSATCTFVAQGSYPNSLSFVPKGTLDPDKEALVGYLGSTYVRIDTVTGGATPVGDLGAGFASSGDLFSLIGGGTYLTVAGNGCSDCLAKVDPTTGALIGMVEKLPFGQVWGLASWGGVAYGFTSGGLLFQIDLATLATAVIPIPNAPPGLSFWGAGSSTAADK